MEEARALGDHSALAAPTNFPPYGDSATARSSAVEGAPCSLNGSARPGCPAKPNARGSVSGRRRHPRKSHRDRAGLGSDGAMATIHAFGPFRLDADAEILFRGSDPLPVGKRAVAVLRVLVERAGAPVSKDTLIDAAWAGWRSRRAISQCKLPHCVGHSARCRWSRLDSYQFRGRRPPGIGARGPPSFGKISEATAHAKEASALAQRLGARGSEAHALCLNGDVASARGVDDADGYYGRALALAEPSSMRPLVAHCHLGLGKMHRRAGNHGRDQGELGIATAMYREMEMPYWLERAQGELSQLS